MLVGLCASSVISNSYRTVSSVFNSSIFHPHIVNTNHFIILIQCDLDSHNVAIYFVQRHFLFPSVDLGYIEAASIGFLVQIQEDHQDTIRKSSR